MSLEEVGEEVISWFNRVWKKADSGFMPEIHHAFQAMAFVDQIKFGDADPERYGGDCLDGICSLSDFGLNTIIPMQSKPDQLDEEKQMLTSLLKQIKTDRKEQVNRVMALLKS